MDEAVIEKEKNIREITYKKQSIYLLHYIKSQEVEVSYGKILDINEHKIRHLCNTENGSSGSPILSLKSFKVIGIHYRGINNRYNIGTLIKYPIDEFNEKFYRKNKLTLIFEGFYNGVFFGQRFVENNKNNCKLIINSSE